MKLLLWMETSVTTPGTLDDKERDFILSALRAWTPLVESAIVTVDGRSPLNELKPIVMMSPLPVIASIKVSPLLIKFNNLENPDLWKHVLEQQKTLSKLTGRPELVLELESALEHHRQKNMPLSGLKIRSSIISSQNLWWYPSIAEEPERRDRFLSLARSLGDIVRPVDSGKYWSFGVMQSPGMQQACNMLRQSVFQRPICVLYTDFGESHPYWTTTQLKQWLPKIANNESELIIYPGRTNAVKVANVLRNDVNIVNALRGVSLMPAN